MAAPCARMLAVTPKRSHIGLNRLFVFEKNVADPVARQLLDEKLGIIKHGLDLLVRLLHVEGMFRRQNLKLVCRERAVAADFGKHFLGRHARKATDSGTDDRAER